MLCAQAWKPSSQHAGEKRGVAGLLLGRTVIIVDVVLFFICRQSGLKKKYHTNEHKDKCKITNSSKCSKEKVTMN